MSIFITFIKTIKFTLLTLVCSSISYIIIDELYPNNLKNNLKNNFFGIIILTSLFLKILLNQEIFKNLIINENINNTIEDKNLNYDDNKHKMSRREFLQKYKN